MSSTVSRGRHRRRADRVTIAGVLPLALAIAYSGVATAAPAAQPGVPVEDAPQVQPGVPVEESPAELALAPAPAPEPEVKEYWVAPPVEYDNVPTRPAPTSYYEDDAPIAPASVGQLHLPVAVEPVAPIEAPAERLRLGDYVADKPNWLSEGDLAKTNNTAAAYEAQMNTAWQSVGVESSRADRIAAATIAGAAAGGIGAAAGAGIPAAVVGGLVGGYVGTVNSAPAGLGAAAVTAGLGFIPVATLNIAGGAAIGAAVAGIPVAVVAGTVGAVAGAAQGMAFGAGDTLAEPIEMEIPDAPTVDPAAITQATRDTVAQVETYPGGPVAVDAVRDAVLWVPPQIDGATAQVRTAALAQPGGPEIVHRVEAGAAVTAEMFAPINVPAGVALGAVRDGLVS